MVGVLVIPPVVELISSPAFIIVVIVVIGSEGPVVTLLGLGRDGSPGGRLPSRAWFGARGETGPGSLECLYRLTHAEGTRWRVTSH